MDDRGSFTLTDFTDLDAAEKIIRRWDPSAGDPSSSSSLFDDREESNKFLLAVDDLRRLSNTTSAAAAAIQIAMARLEDEFRNILISNSNSVEVESLLDLSSLSISATSVDFSADPEDGHDTDAENNNNDEDEDDDVPSDQILNADASFSARSGRRRSSCRSASGIYEIDVVHSDAIDDLRSIADRMVACGYSRECVQTYAAARKPSIDSGLQSLGVERLSIGDVQRLEWQTLESKIRRWIRAAKAAVRILFAAERRLSDRIFDADNDNEEDIAAFAETVRAAAIQLFSFPEAISIGRRSPEKLFKILDLHDALADLLPDIATVFRSRSSDSIHSQAAEIQSRLAEAARGILSEFEHAVLREPSRVAVPGGTIHPLTRYVMNYISLISDYKPTLAQLIVSRPSAPRFSSDDDPNSPGIDIDFPEFENQSPLATHLIWIIVVLQYNLDSKASLYRDKSMSHFFLMNNVHYIVNKIKGSPELLDLIGYEYLKRLTGKYRQSAISYQRATLVRILHCLRDEGIHVSGSFSSGVSKSTLRERFKSFNAAFDEAHRTQATWHVPDGQLREELRISILEKLLPAYRSFIGRFGHTIESERHPEMYIKYCPEDLEIALADFFEGCPPSVHSRRRSHG